jgi:hypothetical protein
MTRRLLYAGLLLVFLLHNDLWLWDDSRSVAGLPVGLTYHVAFCLVVALLMGLLVRYAWPRDLESADDR